jgi:hypothetical protein
MLCDGVLEPDVEVGGHRHRHRDHHRAQRRLDPPPVGGQPIGDPAATDHEQVEHRAGSKRVCEGDSEPADGEVLRR